MTPSLNSFETNCHYLYSFSPYLLEPNEKATLHLRTVSIAAHRIDRPSVESVVLSTLEVMVGNMAKPVPVSSFVVQNPQKTITSYKELALRLKNLYPNEAKIQLLANQVVMAYNSLYYKLKHPLDLSKMEIKQIHDFVNDRIFSTPDSKAAQMRSETLVDNLQKQIHSNRVWDSKTKRMRPLQWLISGAWRPVN